METRNKDRQDSCPPREPLRAQAPDPPDRLDLRVQGLPAPPELPVEEDVQPAVPPR